MQTRKVSSAKEYKQHKPFSLKIWMICSQHQPESAITKSGELDNQSCSTDILLD